jgi:transposase
MGRKEMVGYRRYTDEFKVEAVRLGESVGITTAAKRLGVPHSSLWNWSRGKRGGGKRQSREGGAEPVKRSMAEVEAENIGLRRELASTRLDLEIVKKAAAYFAKESR